MFDWKNKNVLVTGGASFIGSSLVDALLEREASVKVIDDMTSGKLDNINEHINAKRIEFIKYDIRTYPDLGELFNDVDIVFHLAADHGGRGYVDLHQAGPASNFFLDGAVFWHALKAKVEKVVFASSGCVYPNYIQADTSKELFLKENMAGPPYDADNMYGWAKLMGEMTLKAYSKEKGLKTASCRYFTVYGPRGVENHALIAMIARAFIKQDPFEVWGDGTQIRNWTYIDDIVSGTMLAAEKIDDGTAVNLGTMERNTVLDAVNLVLEYTGHKAKLKFKTDMPVGPLNRVADNVLAKKLLGWEPKVLLKEGLKRTIDWYYSVRNKNEIAKELETLLTGR
ncbi:MAG: GDP-L-fucose synthase 1 [Candidatus Melainabacteria bacterium RIFCSPLOWO2_02_FULL_35_15]|nr:MAG: GDP-L-fucose synthase 1 [Candidatus Melainabacteria bacterium RIFCSPLOWO2_12_FULL_35_11]OGI14555.1 MAG: GDP-L-fucose synthase 1 [Candidatus Melainabacteria bacterium RIFCSPLOWO2_02_FULL_35_15]